MFGDRWPSFPKSGSGFETAGPQQHPEGGFPALNPFQLPEISKLREAFLTKPPIFGGFFFWIFYATDSRTLNN